MIFPLGYAPALLASRRGESDVHVYFSVSTQIDGILLLLSVRVTRLLKQLRVPLRY